MYYNICVTESLQMKEKRPHFVATQSGLHFGLFSSRRFLNDCDFSESRRQGSEWGGVQGVEGPRGWRCNGKRDGEMLATGSSSGLGLWGPGPSRTCHSGSPHAACPGGPVCNLGPQGFPLSVQAAVSEVKSRTWTDTAHGILLEAQGYLAGPV